MRTLHSFPEDLTIFSENEPTSNVENRTSRSLSKPNRLGRACLIYPNFSCPKGLCLIINNENFSSMPRRQGTEIDCANLRNLFHQLGYNVLVENDLSCKEMLAQMRLFASDPRHRLASSTVVVVLTHGERDQLLDDDMISVYSFLEMLNAKNAPLLAGKPKLIFIQACRGDRRDTGATYLDQTDGQQLDGSFGLFNCIRTPPTVVVNGQINSLKPRESDFLIAYATPPTYVSWRNSLRGSWFVQAICEVFGLSSNTLQSFITQIFKEETHEIFKFNHNSNLYAVIV
ncbi:unnamed protein product [Angiostrongylus costaricensis]|uniref:CASPASE_P20 domain-containing protein n=1 Tax=Angiostrongylus costaricensis TaxID=334426 RepID=A0A0R3PL96_ANGCS|nr:unnamed protein product [Angiostrongylus costaricensis]